MRAPEAAEIQTAETERFLTFSMSGEKYAVPLIKVCEVVPLAEITPVPYTPPYFKGIVNLRGRVVSVMDLRMKLSLSKIETTSETAIIVLDLFSSGFGVIVDSVDKVVGVGPAEMDEEPVHFLEVEKLITREELLGVFQK